MVIWCIMQKIPNCKEGSCKWFWVKGYVCLGFFFPGYSAWIWGAIICTFCPEINCMTAGEIAGRIMCKEECMKSVKWVQNNIEDSGGRRRCHSVVYLLQIDGENTGDFFDTYAAAFIPDTETNRTVYISVCDDDLPEADETFTFYLTLPVSLNFSVYLTPQNSG